MFPQKVTLVDPGHKYWHEDGTQYKSVSKVIEAFKNKFDTEKMSYFSARKALRLLYNREPGEQEVLAKQIQLKKEWADKNKLACDVGTHIHNCLEHYGRTTKILDPKLEAMVRGIYSLDKDYKKTWNEQILYSEDDEVAGTADKILLRPGTKDVIDIDDYKTNIAQGIATSSKYNNRMKAPFDHLEDCNFVHYSLQLSIYAAMIEKQFNMKIGRLRLKYIPPFNPIAFKVVPIIYMKQEAHMMLQSHLNPHLLAA